MYTRKITLRLHETDATGVLYFPQQLRIAQETFECFLEEQGHSLGKIIKGEFLLPVVHAEADYTKPLQVGDQIEIHLSLISIGTTSFTLGTELFLEGGILAGKTSIVHVVIDRKLWKSQPIPLELRECLEQLSSAESC